MKELTRREVLKAAGVTGAAFMLNGAASIEALAAITYFPPAESAGGWRKAAEVTALNNAWNWSHGVSGANDSMVVIRDGRIIFERGSTKTATNIASCAKSVVCGLAAAVAFDKGLLTSSALAKNYLPASWGNADWRRNNLQIKHLMSMSSGILAHDNPVGSTYTKSFILGRAQSDAPGAAWSYASLPIDTLGLILQSRTGGKLSTFLRTNVYNRIGVGSTTFSVLAGSTEEFASRGLSIAPRDAARLGYLMLAGGKWGSNTIITSGNVNFLKTHPSYLDSCTFEATPGSPFAVANTSHRSYAHTWWTNAGGRALGSPVPTDAYYAHGHGEDLLVVVPSRNLVVVRTGSAPIKAAAIGFRQEFMKRVIQAI